jgi:hypothetical protein
VLKVFACFLVIAGPRCAAAQVATDTMPARFATLLGGGNSFGGLGMMFETAPVARSFTLVAAVGYSRARYESDPSGIAGSVGARVYGTCTCHGLFGEVAFLEVAKDVVRDLGGDHVVALYGPGLQVGYRFRRRNGWVIDALAGAGYATRAGVLASRWKPIFGVGIGYRWPRH